MERIVIIGAGPAGISAALYAVRANMDPLVLSNGIGALEKAEKIENFYGQSLSGKELYEGGIRQAQELGVRIKEAQVLGIRGYDTFQVLTDTETIETQSVIIATGAKRQAPKIAGLKELEGRGVSYCAVCDAFFYRGKKTVVLGNGDFALHEASELKNAVGEVSILTNGMLEDFSTEPQYPVKKDKIVSLNGKERLESITFENGETMTADGLFVAIGTAGSTEMAKQMGAQITEKGHIIVDSNMQTTIPGIFAAGDCTGGLLQIAKAVYEGSLAGIEAGKYVRNLNK